MYLAVLAPLLGAVGVAILHAADKLPFSTGGGLGRSAVSSPESPSDQSMSAPPSGPGMFPLRVRVNKYTAKCTFKTKSIF